MKPVSSAVIWIAASRRVDLSFQGGTDLVFRLG
jgi:hypothetical protein